MSIGQRAIHDEKLTMRIALLLLLLWGVSLTLLIPAWQTPDEYTHLTLIGNSWKNGEMADHLMQDMSLDQSRIMGNYDEKVNLTLWQESMTKEPAYSRDDCLPKGVSLSALKHLTASLGLFTGVLLRLPTFWVLELGELFALTAAVGMFALALHLLPRKKEVLLMFMAFPMTMQQVASINYDSMLLPLCFLFVAYLFHLRMEKERLGWREAMIALLLIGWITYIKLPYVFLGLLVLILPREKIHLKLGTWEINGETIRRWRIPAGIVLLLLLCAGVYLMRGNRWIQLVWAMACEWKRSLFLFRATAQTWGEYLLVSSVGQFGWLEAAVPMGFVIASYVLVLFLAVTDEKSEQPYALKAKNRVVIWIISAVLGIFICMSMVNHTIMIFLFGSEHAPDTYAAREALYQIPYIGGLQGRYFLPFLSLPFLALPEIRKKISGRQWLVVGYIVVAAILTGVVLVKRYWLGGL